MIPVIISTVSLSILFQTDPTVLTKVFISPKYPILIFDLVIWSFTPSSVQKCRIKLIKQPVTLKGVNKLREYKFIFEFYVIILVTKLIVLNLTTLTVR